MLVIYVGGCVFVWVNEKEKGRKRGVCVQCAGISEVLQLYERKWVVRSAEEGERKRDREGSGEEERDGVGYTRMQG